MNSQERGQLQIALNALSRALAANAHNTQDNRDRAEFIVKRLTEHYGPDKCGQCGCAGREHKELGKCPG